MLNLYSKLGSIEKSHVDIRINKRPMCCQVVWVHLSECVFKNIVDRMIGLVA